MDFARKELEKYGWQDGQGLGKSQNGISKPVKPKLKFDRFGLGHSIADEMVNPWWADVYNSAANNISVKQSEDQVQIESSTNDSDKEIKNKRKKRKKKAYENFVKTSCLIGRGEEKLNNASDCEEKPKRKSKGVICDRDDEEIFEACGGRTMHKGARHGITMSGKLARLEQQESALLSKKKKLKN